MTQNYHSGITLGAAANAAIVNAPLGQLDAAIASLATQLSVATVASGNVSSLEMFNVKAYGATGDGTTDDTADVQDAIDAAAAVGGVVLFPKGTYILGGLTATAPVHLRGQGWGSVLKLKDGTYTSGTDNNWMAFSNADGFTIADLAFDGNAANQSGLYRALWFLTAHNVNVRNLYFHDVYGQCTGIADTLRFIVSDIICYDISGAGGNPGEGVVAFDSGDGIIKGMIGKDLDDHLVYIDGNAAFGSSHSIIIADCVGNNCGRVTGSSAYKVARNSQMITFSNCFSRSSGMGFTVEPASPDIPADISFIGCVAENSFGGSSGAAGFTVGTSSNRISFTNCKAYRNGYGVAGMTGHGFNIVGANAVTLTNCEAYENNDNGLFLNECTEVEVAGGKFIDNSLRSAGAYQGISVAGASVAIRINGPRCTDTRAAGSKTQAYGLVVAGTTSDLDATIYGAGNATGSWVRNTYQPATCRIIDMASDGGRRSRIWGTDAPTTGTWEVGDTVVNTTPTRILNIAHWTCYTAGTPGSWMAYGMGWGTTAERTGLSLDGRDAGYAFFDTTLGEVAIWNGGAWAT